MSLDRLRLISRRFSVLKSRNSSLTKALQLNGRIPVTIQHGMRDYSTTPVSVKPGIVSKLKDGVVHYWQGSKLLAYETRISFRLFRKVLRGERLIRREYRQLLRTTADLFRLVPFIIIALVPFLEFALPVILKFFPNMLPSTFEDKLQAEEKIKKQLKVKLETAKFLQDMAEQMSGGESSGKLKDLKELFKKTRTSGINLTAEEVFAISRQLGNEITLDNLTRSQLSSLCRYMSLKVIGTSNFLRYQIQRALQKLKVDDEMIVNEGGVDSLTLEEVKSACHARGIRSIGVPERYMRSELAQWIDLHVKHNIPGPILILSRAFALSEDIDLEGALKAAVVSLPDAVFAETEAQVASSGTGSQPLTPAEIKLQIIKEQEQLIFEELEQEKPTRRTSATVASGGLENEQLHAINEAVVTLATEDPAAIEKQQLSELKHDKDEYLSQNPNITDDTTKQIKAQVDKLIHDIDEEIVNFESEISKRLEHITFADKSSISSEQLAAIMKLVKNSPKESEKIQAAIKSFDADGDGKIFISDISALAKKAFEEEEQER